MSERINWSMNVQVVGGTKVSQSGALEVQASGKISITVGGDPVTVRVVSAEAEDDVEFLLVSASRYDDALSYEIVDSVEAAAVPANLVRLNAPQMLIGTGAVSLLGRVPHLVRFSNGTGSAIDVTVLVGGKAEVVPSED